MTPCARGCCWSPWMCSKNRACECHWDDARPAIITGGALATHRDPTAAEAIYNIEKERRGK